MATTTTVKSNVTKRTLNSFWWAECVVPDLAKAKSFYGELMGLTFKDLDMGDGPAYSIGKHGGCDVAGFMELSPQLQAQGVPPNWLPYVLVADIEATAAKAKELGASVMQPPTKALDAGWFSVIVDPTGAALGLWQAGTFEGADLVNHAGGLSWTDVKTTDIEATKAFYTGLFGWEAKKRSGDDAPFEYWTFDLAGRPVCGTLVMGAGMEGIPAHWNAVMGVADVDVAAEYVAEHGGKVEMAPRDFEFGRMSQVNDNQGANLTLMSSDRDEWTA
jgi:predicted enzyme related to lactoylglutathione lyase